MTRNNRLTIAFCSQKKSAIVNCTDCRLVYIPLTEDEAKYLGLENWGNPAIRVRIPREAEEE